MSVSLRWADTPHTRVGGDGGEGLFVELKRAEPPCVCVLCMYMFPIYMCVCVYTRI